MIDKVDVDTAFLYGKVKEAIYMDQPDDFEDAEHQYRRLENGFTYAMCTSESKDVIVQ